MYSEGESIPACSVHNAQIKLTSHRIYGIIFLAIGRALALLLVLSLLSVYAGEQQTEQTETPAASQDTGSESVESVTSSEQDEFAAVELDPLQPINLQEPEVAAIDNWENIEPYIGILLHEGYIGFKNKSSKNYLTIPNGSTAHGTNVCQQSEKSIPNAQEFFLSYTWKPEKNMAYFTIYPVDLSGNTVSTRVKAGSVNASTGVANVSLLNFNTKCCCRVPNTFARRLVYGFTPNINHLNVRRFL